MLYVSTIFNGNLAKKYSYKTDIPDLKKKDWVVVETNNGYSAAQVYEYITETKDATKFVVQKITPRETDIWQ